jgi:hypothetical protein
MPSRNNPDFSPGTVLHIKGFSSRGHSPKDKYLILIGSCSEDTVLAFLISSQMSYLSQQSHKSEVVRIPHNATAFLRRESLIQCFEIERLSVEVLKDGIEAGDVTTCGKLPVKYLHMIRETVSKSNLLAQQDIEAALVVLPPPSKR